LPGWRGFPTRAPQGALVRSVLDARRTSVREAEAIFTKHGLDLDERGVSLIADTILTARGRVKEEKGQTRFSIARYRRALAQAEALLRFAERAPTRGVHAVRVRASKLRDLLSGAEVAVRFAVLGAGDINVMLEHLENGHPSRAEIEHLCGSLRTMTARVDERRCRLGRPPSVTTYVVRGGLIAWRNAGRKERYSFDDAGEQQLRGALPDFLRELLQACGIPVDRVGDRALMMQIHRNRRLL
jgi:hypothetical protein